MSGWGTIYSNTKYSLSMYSQRIAALQEQVASGARVNRASDDPGDAYRIMRLKAQSASLEQYERNVQEATRTLELGHSLISEVSNNLQSVLQKVEQAASGTYSDANRVVLGEDINSILDQVLALANTENLGQYVFSGANSHVKPYAAETQDGYVTAVTYQGSRTDLPVPIAPGVEMSGVTVGEEVFRRDDRRPPEFLGETGVSTGTGTSTVRGNLSLELTHKETNVVADAAGTNLQISGVGPAHTVLGRHDLVVDVQGQTIRFADGGPSVSFDGTETALAVADSYGNSVFVDVSALNGAVVGEATVTIQSDGYLTFDGGPAAEVSDYTDTNVAVTDPDGRVLYVNATGIHATGRAPVRVPGTADLFETLIYVRDVLLNERELSTAEQLELVKAAALSVDEVMAGVTQSMTFMGGRLEALDTLEGSLEAVRANADDQAATLENADIVQLAADLARMETLYEMTLATASKLLNMTLLDYL